MKISIVITTFNEEKIILNALKQLQLLQGIFEIVIVDGGSTDSTINIIQKFIKHENLYIPIKFYSEKKLSRGGGLSFGAQKSSGDIIWFLHIDSIVQQQNVSEVKRVIDAGYDMGAFRLKFNEHPHPIWYRGIEIFVRLRSLLFKMFHGDQGVFVTRSFLTQLGGYPIMPLMEDVKFSQLGRRTGKLYASKIPIFANPRKISSNGFFKMVFLYFYLKTLYYFNFDINYIAKKYRALK